MWQFTGSATVLVGVFQDQCSKILATLIGELLATTVLGTPKSIFL